MEQPRPLVRNVLTKPFQNPGHDLTGAKRKWLSLPIPTRMGIDESFFTKVDVPITFYDPKNFRPSPSPRGSPFGGIGQTSLHTSQRQSRPSSPLPASNFPNLYNIAPDRDKPQQSNQQSNTQSCFPCFDVLDKFIFDIVGASNATLTVQGTNEGVTELSYNTGLVVSELTLRNDLTLLPRSYYYTTLMSPEWTYEETVELIRMGFERGFCFQIIEDRWPYRTRDTIQLEERCIETASAMVRYFRTNGDKLLDHADGEAVSLLYPDINKIKENFMAQDVHRHNILFSVVTLVKFLIPVAQQHLENMGCSRSAKEEKEYRLLLSIKDLDTEINEYTLPGFMFLGDLHSKVGYYEKRDRVIKDVYGHYNPTKLACG